MTKLKSLCLLAILIPAVTLLSSFQADAARSGASSGSGCLPGVLKTRLSQIRARFGSVRVISTFRRGARIAGSGRRSYHASCRAVDFLPPAGKYRAVVAWLKSNHFGGIGTYSCGMNHIHIDNGPSVRFHHCVNRRGRTTRYAQRRRTYRKGRATRVSRNTVRRSRRVAANRSRTRRTAQRTIRASTQRPKTRSFTTARYMRRLTQEGS